MSVAVVLKLPSLIAAFGASAGRGFRSRDMLNDRGGAHYSKENLTFGACQIVLGVEINLFGAHCDRNTPWGTTGGGVLGSRERWTMPCQKGPRGEYIATDVVQSA
jgi:hypothetical protein